MKRIILAFSGFVFAATSLAQQQVKISGSIANSTTKEISFTTKFKVLGDEAKTLAKAQLDDKGNFTTMLLVTGPMPVTLNTGIEVTDMYIQPNDSINLSVDAKTFDATLKYSGRGADANNYLAKSALKFASLHIGDFSNMDNFKIEKTTYFKTADSIATVQRNFLKENQNKNFSKAFTNYLNAEYTYGNVRTKSIYNQMSVAMVNGNDQEKTLNSKPDLSVYADVKIMNEDAIQSEAYMQTVMGNYGDKAKDDYLKTHPIKGMEDFVAVSRNQYYMMKSGLAADVRDFVLGKFVKAIKTYLKDSALTSELMKDYQSININKDYMAQLETKEKSQQELQAEQRQKMQEQANAQKLVMQGKPAPEFNFADINGKTYSLKDFKGKVVYLDAWASWCGPCKQQIPAAKELEEKFKGKDVAFVAVSIDANEDAWKKCLADLTPAGLHLLAKGDGGAFSRNYGIMTIPRYYIIDRNGNIVDADAKRPSMGVETDLDELLKK
ncbi:MAG: TlpA disulfide reductase family protein [Bacteroidia bacterium]